MKYTGHNTMVARVVETRSNKEAIPIKSTASDNPTRFAFSDVNNILHDHFVIARLQYEISLTIWLKLILSSTVLLIVVGDFKYIFAYLKYFV
jgi:hypothetical protein